MNVQNLKPPKIRSRDDEAQLFNVLPLGWRCGTEMLAADQALGRRALGTTGSSVDPQELACH